MAINPGPDKSTIEAGQGQFLRLLVHEMRNLAAPIRNAVHVLRLNGKSDSRTLPMVDIIERQIVAMDQMLNRIGDAVRASQGQVTLEIAEVALADIIEKAIATVKPALESRQQRLHLDLPSTPIRVRADAPQLIQVLGTMLDNASKYTPEQGNIFITASDVGGRINVRVRDTGAGISSELLPTLFDFFPVRNRADQRQGAGLGLSLATARAVVESHGGRITATSGGPGAGSEFVVDLPSAGAQTSQTQTRPELESSRAKYQAGAATAIPRRVLIADDSEPVRTSLSSLLSELGHEVKCATDGEQALKVAREWRPEFVLLDINMPKLGGVEVARRLRPEFSSAVMKLVMMSGADMDQTMVAGAKRAGFDFVLDKIDALEPLRNILAQGAPAGS